MNVITSVVDLVSTPMFLVDQDGSIVHCNGEARRIVDCGQGTAATQSFGRLFPALPPLSELFDAVRREVVEGRTDLLLPSGERVGVRYRASLVDLGDGSPVFLGIETRPTGSVEVGEATQIANGNPSPVLRISKDGTILYANPGSWLVLDRWAVGVGDKVPEQWRELVARTVDLDETQEATLTAGAVTVLLMFVPAAVGGYVTAYGVDITRQRQMEQKILLNAQVFQSTEEGIAIVDDDLRIVDVNPGFSAVTGYSPVEVLGEQADFLWEGSQSPEQGEAIRRCLAEGLPWTGEAWVERKSGDVFARRLSISPVRSESSAITHYVCLVTDVTARKEAEDKLYTMAHYDALTGLANRRLFRERLREAIHNSNRGDEAMCVLVVDLDGFKAVNDEFGHGAGDLVLRSVAKRIGRRVRHTDTVARMGGDEFAVILTHLTNSEDAAPIARSLLEAVAIPVVVLDDGTEVSITASIGLAVYPANGSSMEALLSNADNAMYRIKRHGKNGFRFCSEEAGSSKRHALRSRLRHGLQNDEIVVHYQPQIEIQTGKLFGVEAFARWRDADEHYISPASFIPVAEDSGLIHKLGHRVLKEAFQQAAAWRREEFQVPRIGINVSMRQLAHGDFLSVVERTAADTGFDTHYLGFDLTEDIPFDLSETIVEVLRRLSSLGISLTIDDFGTRRASLIHLSTLPITVLKIDQDVVRGLPEDDHSAEIASTIMAMSRNLGMEVMAEGIETRGQLDYLRNVGCKYGQGFLIGVPAAADELASAMVKTSEFGALIG